MSKGSGPSPPRGRLWRHAATRALLLGPAAAIVGALFGVLGGWLLCLADGTAWEFALWWGLRGAIGGLAAGGLMGAMSGIYHVEEARPESEKAPSRPTAVGNGTAPALPTPVDRRRNGVRAWS
jgi:hypothetical protein